jgi:transposase-like protein
VLNAVGADVEGKKHILGATAVKALLTRLREQGLPADRKDLFIIDGAKALRAGIEEVFGSDEPVQRCRNHKPENVMQETVPGGV